MAQWSCPAGKLIQPANATREAWLALKPHGIGGGDIPALMGAGRYDNETPFEVWRRKTGRSTGPDDNPAMMRGRVLEPIVADMFTEQTGVDCRVTGMYEKRSMPILRGSPDRLTADDGGLEIKTTTRWGIKAVRDEFGTDPDPRWVWQSQAYMTITGKRHWWIAVLVIDTWELILWRLDADDTMAEQLTSEAERFWKENVLADTPPAMTASATVDEIQARYPTGEGALDVSAFSTDAADLNDALAERRRVEAELKDLKDTKTRLDDYLKKTAGEHDTVSIDGSTVFTWRGEDRTTFDKKTFARDYPELAEKYQVTNKIRVLRVKKGKK